MTTQQNVVVMVIGIGRIGKIHASNLVQMNNGESLMQLFQGMSFSEM